MLLFTPWYCNLLAACFFLKKAVVPTVLRLSRVFKHKKKVTHNLIKF